MMRFTNNQPNALNEQQKYHYTGRRVTGTPIVGGSPQIPRTGTVTLSLWSSRYMSIVHRILSKNGTVDYLFEDEAVFLD